MYTVEDLTARDYQWAVQVAAKNMIIEEVKRPDLYNMQQFELLANLMLQQKTVVIAKMNGRPVGVIGALVNPNVYNPNVMTMAEILWYVLPEHRGGRAGYLLLKAIKEKADDLADELTLSTLAQSAVNDASLARMGFEFAERAYFYKSRKE